MCRTLVRPARSMPCRCWLENVWPLANLTCLTLAMVFLCILNIRLIRPLSWVTMCGLMWVVNCFLVVQVVVTVRVLVLVAEGENIWCDPDRMTLVSCLLPRWWPFLKPMTPTAGHLSIWTISAWLAGMTLIALNRFDRRNCRRVLPRLFSDRLVFWWTPVSDRTALVLMCRVFLSRILAQIVVVVGVVYVIGFVIVSVEISVTVFSLKTSLATRFLCMVPVLARLVVARVTAKFFEVGSLK